MKKKLIAFGLACAVPLSSGSFNFCSAHYSTSSTYCYKMTNPQEEYIQQLKRTIDDLKKDNEIQKLQNEIEQLKKEKNRKIKSKNSIWVRAKHFLKNSLGLTLGVGALIAVLTAILMAGTAAFDCATDSKCHFDDKTFLEKFNREILKHAFGCAKNFAMEMLSRIHTISVQVENDDQ